LDRSLLEHIEVKHPALVRTAGWVPAAAGTARIRTPQIEGYREA
jgi:hypothetical protein